MQRATSIMQPENDFLRCYVCGTPALWVIELAGEDEPLTEEAACAEHARGHWHRALLTAPGTSPMPPGRPVHPDELPDPDREHRPDEPRHPGAPPSEPEHPHEPMPHPIPS
jgi:hypothetical protein